MAGIDARFERRRLRAAVEQLLERLEELDQVHVQERGARTSSMGRRRGPAGTVLVAVESDAHLQRRRLRRAVESRRSSSMRKRRLLSG